MGFVAHNDPMSAAIRIVDTTSGPEPGEVTSFGVMVGLGAVVGLWLFHREIVSSRLPEGALDGALAGVVGGLLFVPLTGWLWLDPAIADEALYAEHWSGNRDVVVTLDADHGDQTVTRTALPECV